MSAQAERRRAGQGRHLGAASSTPTRSGRLHRQDAAVRRAVGGALGDVQRGAGGHDPEPGGRHAEGRRRPRALRRLARRPGAGGRLRHGALELRRGAARRAAGRATGSATTTRCALLAAFAVRGKPVLGICRGLQLMNVAHGGTLLQDIDTLRPGPVRHRDAVIYDRNLHAVEFVPGTRLAEVFEGTPRATVNSVHHQGIKDLAAGFVVEARCPSDGMIEAIRKPRADLHGRGAMASRVPPRGRRHARRQPRFSTTSSRAAARRPATMTSVLTHHQPCHRRADRRAAGRRRRERRRQGGARPRRAAGVGGAAAGRAQGGDRRLPRGAWSPSSRRSPPRSPPRWASPCSSRATS